MVQARSCQEHRQLRPRTLPAARKHLIRPIAPAEQVRRVLLRPLALKIGIALRTLFATGVRELVAMTPCWRRLCIRCLPTRGADARVARLDRPVLKGCAQRPGLLVLR